MPTQSAARERVLDAASELFYREGIRAVGIDTIIARAGVAKMTFYHHFKSKDLLVVEFLRRRDERWRRWLAETVERLSPDPRERPLAIFDALAGRFANPDYRGCAFINTVAETADPGHAARHAVLEHVGAHARLRAPPVGGGGPCRRGRRGGPVRRAHAVDRRRARHGGARGHAGGRIRGEAHRHEAISS